MSTPRNVLSEDAIHPAITDRIRTHHRNTVEEVRAAVAADTIVVVGMAQNPVCKRARKLLKGAGREFTYLEYGSYFSEWRKRTAIKMWTGWPTFPMIFIKGTLVGGADDLEKLIEGGELDTLLDA